jgi:hypothetical protein
MTIMLDFFDLENKNGTNLTPEIIPSGWMLKVVIVWYLWRYILFCYSDSCQTKSFVFSDGKYKAPSVKNYESRFTIHQNANSGMHSQEKVKKVKA